VGFGPSSSPKLLVPFRLYCRYNIQGQSQATTTKPSSKVLRTGGFGNIITSSFVFVSWEYFEEGSELGRNGHVDVPMVLQQEYAISRLNFLACLDLQGDQSASVKFLPNFYFFGIPYCTI
jgi:hypothetical protein